jgi:hypothetical protein
VALTQLGLGVVIFDYRGHGQSEGTVRREADLFVDGEAFYQELSSRSNHVIIYGESMGSGVAACLSQRHPCEALILQSPFTSMRERVGDTFPFLPVGWLCRYPLEVRNRIKDLPIPKLIMHSPTDEVIAFHHGAMSTRLAASPSSGWSCAVATAPPISFYSRTESGDFCAVYILLTICGPRQKNRRRAFPILSLPVDQSDQAVKESSNHGYRNRQYGPAAPGLHCDIEEHGLESVHLERPKRCA